VLKACFFKRQILLVIALSVSKTLSADVARQHYLEENSKISATAIVRRLLIFHSIAVVLHPYHKTICASEFQCLVKS
jgi:hypothetical protein